MSKASSWNSWEGWYWKKKSEKTTSERKNYFMSPVFTFSYLLTAGQVLPRPKKAVKEAVEDVQGQLK